MAQSHIKLSGGAGTGKSLRATITQPGHGFVAGQAVRFNRSAGTGTGTDQYYAAKADSATNSEVVGVIQSVGANTFVLVYSGEIDSSSFDPNFAVEDDDVFFLSDTTAGKLSKTPPSEAGSVIKPVLVRTNDDVCIVTNYIGTIIGGSSTVSLNGIQPVGTIEPYAGTSADVPETWSICDGGALTTTTYPSLYNRVGKRYGYHVKIEDAGISGDIFVGNRVRQGNNISGIITSVTDGSMEVDVDHLIVNSDGSYTEHNNNFTFSITTPLTIDDSTTGKVGSITPFVERDDLEDIELTDYSVSVIKFRKPDLRGKFVLGAADAGQATAIDVPSPGFKLGQIGGDYEADSSNGNVGTVESANGGSAVNTTPPYQSLNWIIKLTANAPAALIDNLTASIALGDLTDVSAPSDGAQSGDVIMFDSTNSNGAKYYPYRLFDAFPVNNKVFNVSNAAGDASIRFGNTSTTQAFRIDLEGLQPNGTNRQFRVTNGVNILQAQKSNLNHGVVGVGVTPQNDDAANLVVGSKGLRFSSGSSPTITRVKTTIDNVGSDSNLVTEQGIREAITASRTDVDFFSNTFSSIGADNSTLFNFTDPDGTHPGNSLADNRRFCIKTTGFSGHASGEAAPNYNGRTALKGKRVLLFLGLRVFAYNNKFNNMTIHSNVSSGLSQPTLNDDHIKFVDISRADGDGLSFNSITVPLLFEIPENGTGWFVIQYGRSSSADFYQPARLCSYQTVILGNS